MKKPWNQCAFEFVEGCLAEGSVSADKIKEGSMLAQERSIEKPTKSEELAWNGKAIRWGDFLVLLRKQYTQLCGNCVGPHCVCQGKSTPVCRPVCPTCGK